MAIPLCAICARVSRRSNKHGQRANSIITGMQARPQQQQQSRGRRHQRLCHREPEPGYGGIRAKDASSKSLSRQPTIPPSARVSDSLRCQSRVHQHPQQRVPPTRKKQGAGAAYAPVISVRDAQSRRSLGLLVRDNGGVRPRHPEQDLHAVLHHRQPPGAKAPAQGLSISHDIGARPSGRDDPRRQRRGPVRRVRHLMPARLHRGASDRSAGLGVLSGPA